MPFRALARIATTSHEWENSRASRMPLFPVLRKCIPFRRSAVGRTIAQRLYMRTVAYLFAATLLFGPLAPVCRSDAAPPPEGAQLYARHCERCHGISGRGDGPDAELFVSPPRNLRDGILTRYSTEDLTRRIRTGAPLNLALDVPALREHAEDVEALAAHLRRLPSVDWRRVEYGQQVYVDRCELCHGPAGEPGPMAPVSARPPRDLAEPEFQRQITDEDLARAVRHGRNAMRAPSPPVATAEIPPLVAFIRMLSPGFTLYDRYCAACHGDDGRGAGAFATDAHYPTVVFDAAYFRRRDPEQVRAAIWHMLSQQQPAMPHLRATLNETDARAIITFLKQTE
jgi:mono/diheme cytochrome c family protein